ncbi:hypothetical protein RHMOL_Rhmol02G0215000 [Rhododendron molle]|uniref:Uncharacterized protein n=1 Tax=Rhododendron molle TaxID=49168 RepID=A0ACC0PTZ0_RHOML|nr:hypothetical protein RHMOL_Rhmol02G0215000 [Rhododendron molle]
MDERPSAKRWLPLEANPDVMNQVPLSLCFVVLYLFRIWFGVELRLLSYDMKRREPNTPNNHRNNNLSDSTLDFTGNDSNNPDDSFSFRLVDGKPPPRPHFGLKWRFNPITITTTVTKTSSPSAAARKFRLKRIPFSKLSFSIPDPEDLLLCGALEFTTSPIAYQRTPAPRALQKLQLKVTTTDDPVICRLANKDKATVFATDSILSTFMCAPRSFYSWDIVIQRFGIKLFFDKHDGSQLDLLSIHETSQEPLPESKADINLASSLSVEAAYRNQNFSLQVLIRDGNKVEFEEGNPFANKGEEVVSVAYRYRRWKLDMICIWWQGVRCRFLWGLGLRENEAECYDVYGLDEDLLEMVPKPVLAVVFLYPLTAKTEEERILQNSEMKVKIQ